MNKINICIVTPVYNGFGLIQDTVVSVLNQKKRDKFNIFYIICDGGSTDGTLEYINNIANDFSEEGVTIEIRSDKDHGMYDALSKGFEIAGHEHDVYCYINAGDYFSPYAFEVVSELFKAGYDWFTGINVSYSERGFIRSCGVPLDYDRNLIKKGVYGWLMPFIQQESTFWSSRLQEKVDLTKLSEFRYAGDYFLWRTFCEHSSLHVVRVWLSGFRAHEGQLSSVFKSEYFKEFNEVRDKRDFFTLIRSLWLYVINKAPERVRKRWQRKIIDL